MLRSTVETLAALLIAAVFTFSAGDRVYGQGPGGTVCFSLLDAAPAANDGSGRFGTTLLTGGGCPGQNNVIARGTAEGPDAVGVGNGLLITNFTNGGSDIVINLGTNATNLITNGVLSANVITCVGNIGDNINCTVQFDTGGNTFHFTVNQPAVSNAFDNVTINAGAFAFPAPATGPTAQQRTQTVTSLQNSFNSVTPSVLGADGLGLNGGGTGVNGQGINFTPSGLSFNRSNIDSANPMDRDYGAAFAPQGYFAGGVTRQRNNGFNFSINPQAMAARAGPRKRKRLRSWGYTAPAQRTAPLSRARAG